MAITVEMRTEVSQLYVALFGRAPDAEGLGYWTQRLANGESMTSIADTMYLTDPARAYYPLFLTNEEIIASFYVNVLGRVADTEGLNYWTAKLNAAGATPGSVITEMIDVVANYAGTDPDGLTSQALFNNKVEVAQYYGENQGNIADATVVLSTVTADHATVDSTIASIDGGYIGADGLSITLTTGQDVVQGSVGNDVVNGVFGGTASDTYTPGDTVDLGDGSLDTLKLAVAGTTASPVVAVKNTEIITITDTVGGTFDALLVENNPGINFVSTVAGKTSTVANGGLGSVYGLAGAGNLTVGYADTSGKADTAMVSLAGASSATLDVSNTNTVETVAIATTGTNVVTLVGGTAASKLTVTGDGTNTFTLSGPSALAAVATIDASASTGTNTFALGGNFNTGTTIKGGAGADTVSASLASATLSVPTFTGVETFSTTWTAYGVLDLGSTTGLTALSINDKGAGGTVTVQNAQSSLATVTVSNVTTADDVLKFGYASTSKGDLTLKIGSTSATATAVDLGAVTISNSNSLNVTTLGALSHDMDGLTVKGNQTALSFNLATGSDLSVGDITATGNLGAVNVNVASNSDFSGFIAQSSAKTIGDVTINIAGSQSEATLFISGGTDSLGNVAFNITGNDNSGYFHASTSGGGAGNVNIAINGDDNDLMVNFSAGYVSGTDGVGRVQGNVGDVTISVNGDDNTYSGGVKTHDGSIGNVSITVTGDGNDVNFSGHTEHAYYYVDATTATQHSGYYHSDGGNIGNFSMTVDGDSSGDFGLTSSGGNIGDITVVATNDADIDFFVGAEGSEGWYWDAQVDGGRGNIGNVSLTIGDNSTISGGVYTSGGDIGNISVMITGDAASGHLRVEADQDSGGYNLGQDSNDYAGGGNVGDVSISITGSNSYFHLDVTASGGSIGDVTASITGNNASGSMVLNSHPIGSGSTGGDIGSVTVTLGNDAGYSVSGNFDGAMGPFSVTGGDDNWFDFEFGGGATVAPTLFDDSASIASMSFSFGDNATFSGDIHFFSGSVGATTATFGDNADDQWDFSYIKGSVGAMTLNYGTGGDTYIHLGNTGGVGSVGAISYTAGAGSILYLETDGTIASMGAITLTGGDSSSSAGIWLNNTGYNIGTFGGVNASAWAGELGVDLEQVGHSTPATAVGTTVRAGTGGSWIRGTEGADNIFLGTGQDTVSFDTSLDADTKTDVIFSFTAGATKDVLDLYGTPGTLETTLTADAVHAATAEDVIRLVDIAGGQDITTEAGLIAAINAGGEYASVDSSANHFTIMTAASSTAGTVYVFDVVGTGADLAAAEVTLIGVVNLASGNINTFVAGNLA